MHVENKRVLVVGGAGFIGSHLSELLQNQGAITHVLDNLWRGTEERVPQDVTFHKCDLRDREGVETIVEEVDPHAIFHLAALHYIPYCDDNPEETFDVNVMGTKNLLEIAERTSSTSAVMFASSAAVYPPSNTPHSENSLTNPGGVYGKTKLVGEDLIRGFHYRTGVGVGILRLFNVFGPSETNPHLIPEIIEQLEEEANTIELGNLSPKRDFVYVTDVAEAFVDVLESLADEVVTYNVGTGTGHSVNEVVEKFESLLDEKITIEQDSDRVRTDDPDHLTSDISSIRTKVGWEPQVQLRRGIERLVDHHQLG